MISLIGYDVTEQLYKGKNSNIYRGVRSNDKTPLVLKLLNRQYPTPEELTHFRMEYEVTRELNMDGVIGIIGIETYENSLVIIEEDFYANSLRHSLETQPHSIDQLLSFAIRITAIIDQIHQCH